MPAYSQNTSSGLARRVLFVALLVLSLVLTTVYAREGQTGTLHAIQSGFLNAVGIAGGVSAPAGATVQSAGNTVADVTANDQTLTALREQNEQLRRLVADAEEYRQETERLMGLLNMKKTTGVDGPVAHVIGRSTNAWDQSITVDVGTADGVESGMTVMGYSGVIGQVTRAGANTSTVRLLTDPNSGAAVQIQSSRANGIVRGSLTGLLYLEDIEDDKIPVEGDVVITSGLGGSYSSGLIVGTVVSVNRTANNTSGSIVVRPNDNAELLEEVIVVTNSSTWSNATAVPAQSANSSDSDAAADTDADAYTDDYAYDDALAYDGSDIAYEGDEG